MVELSTIPTPMDLAKGVNLSLAMNSVSKLPCGFGTTQNVVAVLVKPSNIGLPLLIPLADATVYVTVLGAATRRFITNQFGVVSIGCFSSITPQGYTVKISHPTADFGKGLGYPGTDIYRSAFEITKPIIIQGSKYITCNRQSLSLNVPTSLQSPTSVLKIGTPPISFGFPEYGDVFPTNSSPASYSIQIDGKQVASGTVGDSRIVNVDFGSIISTPALKALLGRKEVNIKVIVSLAGCTKEGSVYINFPDICSRFNTIMDEPNLPPNIALNNPLFVSLRGIRLECPENPDANKLIDRVKGTVSLGNLPAAPFDISQGSATFDLSKLFPISSLVR